MVLLPRTKPSTLTQLECLLPRYHATRTLREKLNDLLVREASGYEGEQSLDYYYGLLDLKEFPILHGLRLNNGDQFFQMDTLILFPNFFLIIEVKNYSGLIRYDVDSGLLTREKKDGVIERFDDPVAQARVQRHQLLKYLLSIHYPQVPIHTLTVFSNPKGILQIEGKTNDLILSQRLLKRIPELRKYYKKNYLSISELESLGKTLAQHHKPYNRKIIERFNIDRVMIRNGVWCTKCKKRMMVREARSWHCKPCNHSDPNAHIQALIEYREIFGDTITNKEATEFLGSPSRHVTKRLLSHLKSYGTTKGTVYSLKEL
ncbi:nuclease-related domain-containing protein [Filobacillus milosensis]|uniref:nuclease-related domain-containing protein n=1 Tax=Filobacillus milosensis TaxID=94137 RepID=UPI00189181A1|nr:nuclease-related domain-containing protein [Filobacillus milosensis]